jgi:hypothetical protein
MASTIVYLGFPVRIQQMKMSVAIRKGTSTKQSAVKTEMFDWFDLGLFTGINKASTRLPHIFNV